MRLVIFLALFTLAACDYPPAISDEPSSEAPLVPAETYGPPAEVPVSSTEVAITPPEVPEVPEVPVPEVPKTPADVELLKPGTHYPFLPPTVNLFSDLVVPHPIPETYIPETFIPERPLLAPEYPIYHAPAPPPIDIPPINIPPVLPPGVLPPGILPPGVLPPQQQPFHFLAPRPVFSKPFPIPLLPRPTTHHVTTTHIIPPPRVNHVFFEPPVVPEYPLLAPPAPLPPVYSPPVPLPPPVLPAPFPEPVFSAPLPAPVFPAPYPGSYIPEPIPVVPHLPVINEPVSAAPEIPKEPESVPHVPASSYGVPLKK